VFIASILPPTATQNNKPDVCGRSASGWALQLGQLWHREQDAQAFSVQLFLFGNL